MKKYSSSDIKVFSVYCPKALKFQEDGAPRDTSQTDYGVASHAVIEACGNAKNIVANQPHLLMPSYEELANETCQELITNGRTFRGKHEPPMSPEHAFEGKRVALAWLELNELPGEADYEIELTHGRFKALHDVVWIEDWSDEWSEKTVPVSRDWKGWQGRPEELETWQRKCQAITLAANYPDADEIKLEIVNLQTHRTYDRTIVLDDEGLALLDQWKRELEIICRAMDKTREARPGVGCLECPYNHQCNDRLFRDIGSPHEAHKLVNIEIERANTIKALKASQELPVKLEGGYVGWRLWGDNKAKPDAYQRVIDAWDGDVNGMLKALKLGVANINALAKVIWPKGSENDALRQDFIDACIEQRNGQRFGVWRGNPDDS